MSTLKIASKNLYIALLTVILIQGCKSAANITCNNIQNYESNAGIINTTHFIIGDIIAVDTVRKQSSFLGHIKLSDAELSPMSVNVAKETLETKSDLEVSLTGKITKKADNTVQLQVKNAVSKSTVFQLINAKRQNMLNPQTSINSSTLFPVIKQTLSNNKNAFCMVITGLVFADNLNFRLKDSVNVTAGTNIMKFGNFDIAVNYNCGALASFSGTNTGVFYKANAFKLNTNEDQLVVFIRTIKPIDGSASLPSMPAR